MKNTRLTTLLGLALLSATCGEQKPPDVPIWDLDVYPILRGSCGHCHGVSAGPGMPATRYDICNPAAFSKEGITVLGGVFALIPSYVRPSAGAMRMPPPPASPLSDYEATVLERWSKRMPLDCSKQVENRPPTYKIVRPLARSGNKTAVTIEVSDLDGDQVMGKAKLGAAEFTIPGTGRWSIEFVGAAANDAFAVTLFDGYAKGP